MPSPTISRSPGRRSRTAPPRQGPSIIFCGSTGACRHRHGRGRCGGSLEACRPCRAPLALPSPARCCPKDASAGGDSGALAAAEGAGRARPDSFEQRAVCWRRGLPDAERHLAAHRLLVIRSVVGGTRRGTRELTRGTPSRRRPIAHSGCFRLERLSGGTCTHWRAPPSHGAHPKRTRLRKATPWALTFLSS